MVRGSLVLQGRGRARFYASYEAEVEEGRVHGNNVHRAKGTAMIAVPSEFEKAWRWRSASPGAMRR